MQDLKIEYLSLSKIKPYDKNAKLHPREQIDQIKRSIQEFGMDDPLGIWHDEIVEGHGRYLACLELGIEKVPVIRLDHLNDQQRRAYALAHNKLTMNSGFDIDLLNLELSALEIDMTPYGFDIPNTLSGQVQEDDYDMNLPKEPKTKMGQVYQMGVHRLMVGDSTDPIQVQKLMNGAVADLVVTDPPYNVAYEGGTGMTIENDDMESYQFRNFLKSAFENLRDSLKPGGAFYIWYASRTHVDFEEALKSVGLQVREQLIWNKNALVLGRQDYQWKHEPCMYGWKDGAGHYFVDDRTKTTVLDDGPVDLDHMKKADMKKLLSRILSISNTTVIDEKKPMKNDIHPTMKPIKLIATLIANSSRPGDLVLDLFSGGGVDYDSFRTII